MNISNTPLSMIQSGIKLGETLNTSNDESPEFGDFLKQAITEANNLQQQSDDMKTKLVTGQIEDIHQVMIAAEKANLAFQLTLQIRNKAIDAYQEILRMQV